MAIPVKVGDVVLIDSCYISGSYGDPDLITWKVVELGTTSNKVKVQRVKPRFLRRPIIKWVNRFDIADIVKGQHD